VEVSLPLSSSSSRISQSSGRTRDITPSSCRTNPSGAPSEDTFGPAELEGLGDGPSEGPLATETWFDEKNNHRAKEDNTTRATIVAAPASKRPRRPRRVGAEAFVAPKGAPDVCGTEAPGPDSGPLSRANACSRRSRLRGSRSSSPPITAADRPRAGIGGTGWVRTAVRVAVRVSRLNGDSPASAANNVAPRLHRSETAPLSSCSSRSGAAYAAVPRTAPGPVRAVPP